MSNESFWKKIQKTMCPPDKEPPSIWAMMIIVVLLVGVALWLLGVPWQFILAFLLIPLLLVIGGQQLAKRMRKEGYGSYGGSQGPPQKAQSPWATFWFMALLIVIDMLGVVPIVLARKYSSSIWLFLVICGTLCLICLIASIYLYRQRKKQSRKQPDEHNTPITKS